MPEINNINYILEGIFGGSLIIGVAYVTNNVKKDMKLGLKLTKQRPFENYIVDSLPVVTKGINKAVHCPSFPDSGLWSNIHLFQNYLGFYSTTIRENFYENIEGLKVIIDSDSSGEYLFDEKEIHISGQNSDRDMQKGLMLSAASRKINNLYSSGFTRSLNDESKIGYGLTNGYVDILQKRIFDNTHLEFPTGILERDVAFIIESIVGQKDLKRMFFTGALDELIDKLSLIYSKENVIELLRDLDSLHDVMFTTKKDIPKIMGKATFKRIIKHISLLVGSRIEQLNSIEEKKALLMKLSAILKTDYQSGHVKYKSSKDIDEIVEDEIKRFSYKSI